MPFVDADTEIEVAAGCSIEEIFERHGEEAFRDGERRVIARLLEGPPIVLATGGGAFMDEFTRARIIESGVSIWLRADLETLVRRTAKRSNRPLLKNDDPAKTLKDLMKVRHPIYELSDIVKATECLAGVNANHKETIDGLEFDVLAAMTYFSSAKQAVGLSTELPEFQ